MDKKDLGHKGQSIGEFYVRDRKSPLHREGDKQAEKLGGEGI